MKTILSIAIALSAQVAIAAPTLSADFESGKPTDYLADGTSDRVRITAVDGVKVLEVQGTTARFRQTAVKPSTKYTLDLRASFAGDAESIEENPRLEIFAQPGHSSPRMPSREITFYDSAGKPTGKRLERAILFRSAQTYQDVFHTPPDAVSARIGLASGNGRLVVATLKLDETPDEGSLNVNPNFRLGAFNYSGWENIAGGGKLIELDGKTILDTKYGSSTQKFPLAGTGTYAMSARATGNGYNSVVIVRVYDAQGEKLMEASTRTYGPPTSFVPPANAVSASFLVYSCLLEEVKLVRVGDERAIEKTR